MTVQEISNVKKLIKEIRDKLYEIERTIGKTQKDRINFTTNKQLPPTSRKRNPYRLSEK